MWTLPGRVTENTLDSNSQTMAESLTPQNTSGTSLPGKRGNLQIFPFPHIHSPDLLDRGGPGGGRTTHSRYHHPLREGGWRWRCHTQALLSYSLAAQSRGSSKPRGPAAYSNLGTVRNKRRSGELDAAALQRLHCLRSQHTSPVSALGDLELI